MLRQSDKASPVAAALVRRRGRGLLAAPCSGRARRCVAHCWPPCSGHRSAQLPKAPDVAGFVLGAVVAGALVLQADMTRTAVTAAVVRLSHRGRCAMRILLHLFSFLYSRGPQRPPLDHYRCIGRSLPLSEQPTTSYRSRQVSRWSSAVVTSLRPFNCSAWSRARLRCARLTSGGDQAARRTRPARTTPGST